ncbi:peptide chain release factor N(5)-glutamine methyltransferase [Fructilactobacillus myrtifloralis]|uniref:Release factor glutamine methyltransferase n=1 Tax=Fructilactobacillus myrtifloralis TaxID=2940301 RepID=A0ABY5BQ10_9LACO|nr:peptide chain release factor N(5)-glutamine methyltransferase [Fructilactobacillus myrtifloralis]USS85132.1 peptide chain release factor N(5)-glutamine methyltransferase [Fructilactobacillus myrtifloralis]
MPKLNAQATPFEALQWASLRFKQLEIDPEDARYLLMEQLGWNQTELLVHYREPLAADQVHKFQANVERRAAGEPVQYIMGRAPFYGLTLTVTPDVLIPRPETEELVDWVLKDHGMRPLRVLDVGTGSGAIAIAIKQARPAWTVVASDISPAALQVARQNAQAQRTAIEFVASDLLEAVPQTPFDIVISNPPYIASSEVDVMDATVVNYEPKTALFADHQGLELYERLAATVGPYLTTHASVYLEIGYQQGPAVFAIWHQQFPTAQLQVRKDLAGHERMVRMQKGEIDKDGN